MPAVEILPAVLVSEIGAVEEEIVDVEVVVFGIDAVVVVVVVVVVGVVETVAVGTGSAVLVVL
jgi:hypothetical protein